MLQIGPVPYLWGGIGLAEGLERQSGSLSKGGHRAKRARRAKRAKRTDAALAAELNQPWPSLRLSAGLHQAFQQGLDTDVNIQV